MKNKNTEIPWYIKHWMEEKDENYPWRDEEARVFNLEFMPLYRKYVGTKKLLPLIREYINTHEIKRKDDFRFQLICMWCDHIHYYRDLNGIPFKAEDVFKIKIPKEILSII